MREHIRPVAELNRYPAYSHPSTREKLRGRRIAGTAVQQPASRFPTAVPITTGDEASPEMLVRQAGGVRGATSHDLSVRQPRKPHNDWYG
jgi:hypothetical protein